LVELGERVFGSIRGIFSLQRFVEQDGLPPGFARGGGFEQISWVGGQAHFVGPFFCGQLDQLHQIGLGDAPVETVPVGMAMDHFENPPAQG